MANSCGGFVDSFTDTGVRPALHLPLGTSLYYYLGASVSNVGFVETQTRHIRGGVGSPLPQLARLLWEPPKR